MPLTNPNKVVTEERLNEYHRTILPYLGGMPDIMANKFSRADLYSTDEKMIGRWIDGKPLYQKTIELTNFNKNGDNDIGLDSSIQIVNSTVISYDNRNYTYPLPLVNATTAADYYGGYFFTTTNYLGLRVGNYINLTKIIVTVQYTKTTDSSVEIGSDTDYSTTEKIVGTWIDGKPIYQKTIITKSPNSEYGAMNIVPENVEKLLDIHGSMVNRNNDQSVFRPDYGNITMYYPSGTTRIEVENLPAWGQDVDFYITLQYTKTTD